MVNTLISKHPFYRITHLASCFSLLQMGYNWRGLSSTKKYSIIVWCEDPSLAEAKISWLYCGPGLSRFISGVVALQWIRLRGTHKSGILMGSPDWSHQRLWLSRNVQQDSFMYRNIVFHLNRQPPNYKIDHQPVLSAVHTTATKRRFCSTTKKYSKTMYVWHLDV